MLKLSKKYVFHIPLFKYENNELKAIDIDNILSDLLKQLENNGYCNAYITKTKGIYKSRCFDELLLTLFVTHNDFPEKVFKEWFLKNNNTLHQEAIAYECDSKLIVENISSKSH